MLNFWKRLRAHIEPFGTVIGTLGSNDRMDSKQNWWASSPFLSGLSVDGKRSSIFSAAMKSILPVAHAAAAPPAAAPVAPPMPTEPELDPQHPIMNVRRNLVGKAFATHIQSTHKVPKYDDLSQESQGTVLKWLCCSIQWPKGRFFPILTQNVLFDVSCVRE